MKSPIHFLHMRRRRQSKCDPYPHPHPWINLLDRIVLVCGIIGPMTSIPQIMRVFIEKDVSGISVITWFLFAVFNVPWIIYGYVHREKPILIAYILWFITNSAVVIGVLIHS